MKVKRFACCLLVSVLLMSVSLISCGNSSKTKAENEIAQSGEEFKAFLDKFTSSATFQYTRIKFPLKTPITLLADDGETEKTFPFTKEKWPLLDPVGEHVAINPDAVNDFAYIFNAVIGRFELSDTVFGDDDMRTFIQDDTAAGRLHFRDNQRGISCIGYGEHDVKLLPLFDRVIVPDGILYGHARRLNFLFASCEAEGKYSQ